MVYIQSVAAEIRRGKKKRRRRQIEITGQKYNGLPYRATIKKKERNSMKIYMVCPIT